MFTLRPKPALFAVLAVLCTANAAHACAVCMGSADSTEQQGINAALLTMLGLMSIVFAGISFFVVRVAWCAHAGEDASETTQ